MLGKYGITLEYISLEDCQFDSGGAIEIYLGLRRSSKLRTLIMDKNDLYGKSIKDISALFWGN